MRIPYDKLWFFFFFIKLLSEITDQYRVFYLFQDDTRVISIYRTLLLLFFIFYPEIVMIVYVSQLGSIVRNTSPALMTYIFFFFTNKIHVQEKTIVFIKYNLFLSFVINIYGKK